MTRHYNLFLEGIVRSYSYRGKDKYDWKKKLSKLFYQKKPLKKGDVKLKMTFWSKKKVEPRKDLDNMVKTVMDSLTGIIYEDDSQVVEIYAKKEINNLLEGLTLEIFF